MPFALLLTINNRDGAIRKNISGTIDPLRILTSTRFNFKLNRTLQAIIGGMTEFNFAFAYARIHWDYAPPRRASAAFFLAAVSMHFELWNRHSRQDTEDERR